MKNRYNKLFKNADIYVVRVYVGNNNNKKNRKNNNNEDKIITSMSKPCKHCIHFMRSIGIKRVFYTTGDIYNGEWECEKLSEITSDYISFANRRANENW